MQSVTHSVNNLVLKKRVDLGTQFLVHSGSSNLVDASTPSALFEAPNSIQLRSWRPLAMPWEPRKRRGADVKGTNLAAPMRPTSKYLKTNIFME